MAPAPAQPQAAAGDGAVAGQRPPALTAPAGATVHTLNPLLAAGGGFGGGFGGGVLGGEGGTPAVLGEGLREMVGRVVEIIGEGTRTEAQIGERASVQL